MDKISFLAEIFVEELPFGAINREINHAKEKFSKILESYNLSAKIDFFWTPRRLILTSKNLDSRQKDELKEFFGPPLNIAYSDKTLNPAGESFLKKLNINESEVKTREKNGKTCLYYESVVKGRETRELMEEMLSEWLESLNFGKSMQWGNTKSSFIRPIRNVFLLLNDEFIKTPKLAQKYHFKQSDSIIPHRNSESKKINSTESYFKFLSENGVIYDQNLRKDRILSQIQEIEKKEDISVQIDEELLGEIVAITEFPTAILGKFDKKFLELPLEVIITSMKINQKYFAIYKAGALFNGFVVVCNIIDFSAINEVVAGNERVLRARLEDALFFYKNDLQNFVQDKTDEKLKDIEFIEGLGSVFDKVNREIEILKELLRQNNESSGTRDLCACLAISKNDLLSEMVGEFGELQGIMSSYYTQNRAWSEILKEQYLPLQENSDLPSNKKSALLSIAHKLDTIIALFAINKIPSGSKDPFALRRNANGIIKIIKKFNISLNLSELFGAIGAQKQKEVEQFFYERMAGALNVNPSLISAAIKSSEKNLARLILNIEALKNITESPNKDELKSLFKRVANILSETNAQKIDERLLKEPQEIVLFREIKALKTMNLDSPKTRINELLKLKNTLKDFFDNVLINVDDKALKENRVLLVKSLYEEFFKVGDIREISF